MREISEFLNKNKLQRVSIGVIGDSMVDEYHKVKVTRISPESPNVSVMLSETDKPIERLPGGAANVCYQLRNFNVGTNLFSFIDPWSKSTFSNSGINEISNCVLPNHLEIPRKIRFFDGEFQVGDRWDIEKPNYGLDKDYLLSLRSKLQHNLLLATDVNVFIFSDYDKGVFDNVMYNLPKNAISIVDPKNPPLSKWKGCTVFKPNSLEAFRLSDGLIDWKDQCDYFQEKLECQSVVITVSGDGVVGKSNGSYFEHHPIDHVEARKTSGAGDCFVGVLAVAIAHGMSVSESAAVAYEAGALFVQQHSRNPITPWALQKQSKFIDIEDLKDRSYKLVMTNGCFDILHSGHLESLRFAKSKGDKLLVAVNSDESVKRFKGEKRPVVGLHERMEMLAALEFVDFVISFDDDSPYGLIKEIRPEVLVKGADWKDRGGIVGGELVQETYFVPLVEDRSTTSIIDKIKTLI